MRREVRVTLELKRLSQSNRGGKTPGSVKEQGCCLIFSPTHLSLDVQLSSVGMLDFHTRNVTNTQETVYAKNCRKGSRGLPVIFQLDDRLRERHLGSFQSQGTRPTACTSYPSLVSTDVYFPWLPGYLIFIAASGILISPLLTFFSPDFSYLNS